MAASGVQTSATCKMIASSQGTERRFKSHSVSCGPSLTSDLNFINSSSDERDSKISLIIFSRSEYLKLHRFFFIFLFLKHTFKEESLHGAAEAVIKSPDNRNHLHHSSGHADCIMTNKVHR